MGLPVDFLDVGIYDPVDRLEDRSKNSNQPPFIGLTPAPGEPLEERQGQAATQPLRAGAVCQKWLESEKSLDSPAALHPACTTCAPPARPMYFWGTLKGRKGEMAKGYEVVQGRAAEPNR